MSTSSTQNVANRPAPFEERLPGDASPRPGTSSRVEAMSAGGFDPATQGKQDISLPHLNYGDKNEHPAVGDQDAYPSEAPVEDDIPYPERSTDELIHPPDFKPLFILIEDPETSEHNHPTVHYIFSDDDPEILTNATLDALQVHDDLLHSGAQLEEPEERYVILDMSTSGKTVVSASSLSSDWQALKTIVTPAPSWGDAGNEADGKLLLKISGQEIGQSVKVKSKQREKTETSLDELVRNFGHRLDGLDQVMDRLESNDDEERTL